MDVFRLECWSKETVCIGVSMVGSFLECCTAGTALEWNRDLPYDGENLDAGNERSRGVPFAIHQFCPLRS
jgi:hypothetical protein